MSSLNLPPLNGFDLRSPLRGLPGQDPARFRPEGLGLPTGERSAPGTAPVGEPGGFEALLTDSIGAVNALQKDTAAKTRGLALGEDVEVHDIMMASSKSEVAFNLMLEVRNKLVDAWEKLSRSSV
ncbi:MAG: flagellar hook-basal body complex protein FliE [Planctomycetota bacterium]|jgi:flagellar hook-basal body complex protein FliE